MDFGILTNKEIADLAKAASAFVNLTKKQEEAIIRHKGSLEYCQEYCQELAKHLIKKYEDQDDISVTLSLRQKYNLLDVSAKAVVDKALEDAVKATEV